MRNEGGGCAANIYRAMPENLQGRFLDFARNDDGAKRYQNFAALLIFMRRATPLNPPT